MAFCLCGIITAFSNTFALLILSRLQKRIKSHKIVTSLVVSDAIVGYIIFPALALMILNSRHEESYVCIVQAVFLTFTPIAIGPSGSTIAFIAYDRCILLTKFSNYHSYITDKKIYIYLIVNWSIAIACGALWLHSFAYFTVALIWTWIPFTVLVICYLKIIRVVKSAEKELKAHKRNSNNDACQQPTRNAVAPSSKTKWKEIKVVRKVSVLIIAYICCMTPEYVQIILWIFRSHMSIDYTYYSHFFVIGIFCMSVNSCINPILYVLRDPVIHKCIKKMFKRSKNKFWRFVA